MLLLPTLVSFEVSFFAFLLDEVDAGLDFAVDASPACTDCSLQLCLLIARGKVKGSASLAFGRHSCSSLLLSTTVQVE